MSVAYLNLIQNTARNPLYPAAHGALRMVITYPSKSLQIAIISHKRTMLSGKSLYISMAGYHVFSTIFNNDTLNKISHNNHTPLAHALVDLSLQHGKGVMQQKTAITSHMISHKFDAIDTIGAYKILYPNETSVLHFEPNAQIDLRVFNEIPVIHEYHKLFQNDISWTLATLDSRSGNFPHQVQQNQDFWCMIKTKLDRSMGLGYKCVPHDEKSGSGMFKHSSRGTLGLLTYDAETGENVPVLGDTLDPVTNTTAPRSYEYLLAYDKRQFGLLIETFTADNLTDKFQRIIKEGWSILHNKTLKSCDIHDQYQRFLWDNIQRDPQYTRSISFIFTKEVNFEPLQDNALAFHKRFVTLLGNKKYNLDRKGDFDAVYKAMLKAYKETVDPRILEKVEYLQKGADIKFNDNFMVIIDLLKKGLL